MRTPGLREVSGGPEAFPQGPWRKGMVLKQKNCPSLGEALLGAVVTRAASSTGLTVPAPLRGSGEWCHCSSLGPQPLPTAHSSPRHHLNLTLPGHLISLWPKHLLVRPCSCQQRKTALCHFRITQSFATRDLMSLRFGSESKWLLSASCLGVAQHPVPPSLSILSQCSHVPQGVLVTLSRDTGCQVRL